MADNKSSEEKHIVSKEALEIRRKIVERDLDHCGQVTPEQMDTIIDLVKEDSNQLSDTITIGVDIDCSEAIKGLKKIQREAKKATISLKEVEENAKKIKEVQAILLDEGVGEPIRYFDSGIGKAGEAK